VKIVARAPNHLGDGVMALPAIFALADLGELVVQAPGWGRTIYRDVPARIVERGELDRADVAVLFPPSFRAAWEARRAHRRIGVAGDWRRLLLTDVVAEKTHRRDTYAALAAAAGARPEGDPIWRRRPEDPVPDVPEGHIGLNPISVSGATVEWSGFRELADQLGRPVVFYGGPGEEARVAGVAGDHPQRVGLPLDAFAGALSRCAVFVSNDSGSAHFARALGVPTVVVHGSTTASRTGPAGAHPVEGPELPCRPCYRKTCAYGLECLAIPVGRVRAAVEAALGG
jgi:ADP-heptose:LPS heptosyltransferase